MELEKAMGYKLTEQQLAHREHKLKRELSELNDDELQERLLLRKKSKIEMGK